MPSAGLCLAVGRVLLDLPPGFRAVIGHRLCHVGSDSPSICAASSAAFSAWPIPTVATGTPLGIWTIDSSASSPPASWPGMGRPITGRVVFEATTPGRWAAKPAAQMNAATPRSIAPET